MRDGRWGSRRAPAPLGEFEDSATVTLWGGDPAADFRGICTAVSALARETGAAGFAAPETEWLAKAAEAVRRGTAARLALVCDADNGTAVWAPSADGFLGRCEILRMGVAVRGGSGSGPPFRAGVQLPCGRRYTGLGFAPMGGLLVPLEAMPANESGYAAWRAGLAEAERPGPLRAANPPKPAADSPSALRPRGRGAP